MKRYRIFTQTYDGSFGALREASFTDDDAALQVAKQMLSVAEAVDVWDETRRVGLLRRDEAARSAA